MPTETPYRIPFANGWYWERNQMGAGDIWHGDGKMMAQVRREAAEALAESMEQLVNNESNGDAH